MYICVYIYVCIYIYIYIYTHIPNGLRSASGTRNGTGLKGGRGVPRSLEGCVSADKILKSKRAAREEHSLESCCSGKSYMVRP